MKKFVVAALCAALPMSALAGGEPSTDIYPSVEIITSEGRFVVELDGKRAPITVANFVEYVTDGFYDGTIFHRVMPGFVAQAGGFDVKLSEKATRAGIANESGNGLSNRRGSIAMARTGHPHSATAQFYVNLADNPNLDPHPRRWGYCVFGHVVEGIEVLDRIAALPTGAAGPFRSDVPQKTVIIESARLLGEPTPTAK